ncbi:PRC-barrel domain containing protein [Brucella intermedia]|uniref:Sporulation protein YlmC with PRC-barrel domain n=6 Tax=Brucella TaxID=234 RepID=A0ABR6AJS0_9HYPH|nr:MULTISPECIES: PRC-barrel domain-containing protein [Brucella/Ochrobactrum group]ERI16477.1 photosystem reaction center subunit H [Ochrobactrum sp. EGD-AQ16]PJR94627.1 photosystem reaction center subunit H [Ochrobactrum sp. 721/2009]PJT17912.1 photosystem reaction center subunit H [Ochrobactrum sp. 720/2009]PJT20954.1 photosystem reaction center subunit H [Ochrobactrum sp. 715/2009]PJT27001.1 photosystem reaction center subunit H [Ochrobactrum sp. 30A/1000/2015]PJT31247.1 photosystem reacti
MFRTTLLTTTCALLIGGSAFAQTATPSPAPAEAPATTQDMPVSSKDMFGKPITGEAGKVGFVEPKEGQLLVSSFIGRSVYESDAPDAQSVGKLNDLIASPDGQIEAAIIGVGGFLGVGEKDVAVSPDQLQLATRSDGKTWLVIKANKQQLNDAPAFDRSKFFADGVADPSAATETNAPATDTPASGTAPAPASPAPAQ